MNLTDLIQSRRSIGAFTAQPLPDGLIESLLAAAVYAPNHRMTEPWRFIVLTGSGRDRYAQVRGAMTYDSTKGDEDARRKAADGATAKFSAIPAMLVVAMPQSENPEIREEDYAACACLIQNFMLLAWERGIGTAWKTFKEDPRLRELLGLAANEKVVGVVNIGYPAEVGQNTRKPAHERITYVR